MTHPKPFNQSFTPNNPLLTTGERKILLEVARGSITNAVHRLAPPSLSLSDFPESLQVDGASFVTLFLENRLRGCIGTLNAYQPLVMDVSEHAVAAALEDYRFRPVVENEIPDLVIEISRLTSPSDISYTQPGELPALLQPGIDGVILRDGTRRATFLPQVWQSLPEPEEFLNHLCQKMGAAPDLWRNKVLHVSVYQVEEFREGHIENE